MARELGAQLAHLLLDPRQHGLGARVAGVVEGGAEQAAVPQRPQLAEAGLDRQGLLGIEARGLAQHALGHADLAEVVKQRRVGELPELELGEAVGREHGAAVPVRRKGESQRVVRDAPRMAAGRGIARFDRGHARLDEAVEHALDLGLEARALERAGRAAGQHDHQVEVGLAERRLAGPVVDQDHAHGSTRTVQGHRHGRGDPLLHQARVERAETLARPVEHGHAAGRHPAQHRARDGQVRCGELLAPAQHAEVGLELAGRAEHADREVRGGRQGLEHRRADAAQHVPGRLQAVEVLGQLEQRLELVRVARQTALQPAHRLHPRRGDRGDGARRFLPPVLLDRHQRLDGLDLDAQERVQDLDRLTAEQTLAPAARELEPLGLGSGDRHARERAAVDHPPLAVLEQELSVLTRDVGRREHDVVVVGAPEGDALVVRELDDLGALALGMDRDAEHRESPQSGIGLPPRALDARSGQARPPRTRAWIADRLRAREACAWPRDAQNPVALG